MGRSPRRGKLRAQSNMSRGLPQNHEKGCHTLKPRPSRGQGVRRGVKAHFGARLRRALQSVAPDYPLFGTEKGRDWGTATDSRRDPSTPVGETDGGSRRVGTPAARCFANARPGPPPPAFVRASAFAEATADKTAGLRCASTRPAPPQAGRPWHTGRMQSGGGSAKCRMD